MKYCTHCGKQIPDDAIICPECGYNQQTVHNQPQQGYYTAPTDTYSPMSIVGFVLSFVATLAGLIVSIIAYKNAKEINSPKSMTFAKAGIIISSVAIGLSVFVGIITFIFVIFAGVSAL